MLLCLELTHDANCNVLIVLNSRVTQITMVVFVLKSKMQQITMVLLPRERPSLDDHVSFAGIRAIVSTVYLLLHVLAYLLLHVLVSISAQHIWFWRSCVHSRFHESKAWLEAWR